MPHFFFDTDDGNRVDRDDTGLVLEDFGAARRQAVQALPEMAREVLSDGEERRVSVTVRDEAGDKRFRAVLTLHCEWVKG